MNPIIWLIGNIELLMRKCGDKVRTENYKKRLMHCGKNVNISRGVLLIPEHIWVGDNVLIGDNASILSSVANVYIGNHVLFGRNVTIRTGDHRINLVGKYIDEVKENEKEETNDQDVRICDDCWIGDNVIILKGVTIGEGCVIGAGAVVTKSIPPYTVHVGVHSPFEKRRFSEDEIEKHKNILSQ